MRLAAEGAGRRDRAPAGPAGRARHERSDDVARVLALFTDHRLLTVSAGSVEVAHEALLREWPRLRAWIQEDRESMRIHRGVTARGRRMAPARAATTARCSAART